MGTNLATPRGGALMSRARPRRSVSFARRDRRGRRQVPAGAGRPGARRRGAGGPRRGRGAGRDRPGRRTAGPGCRRGCCASCPRSGHPGHPRRGTWDPPGRPWPSGRRPSASRARGGAPCPSGSSGRVDPSPLPTPHWRASAATGSRPRSRAGSARAGSATGSRSGPSRASPRPSDGAGTPPGRRAGNRGRTGQRPAPTRHR